MTMPETDAAHVTQDPVLDRFFANADAMMPAFIAPHHKRERQLFDKMKTACDKRLKTLQLRYLRSFSAKMTAAYRASRRAKKACEVAPEEVEALAASLDPFTSCNEPLRTKQIPKWLSGDFRTIKVPGPRRYALNWLARRLLLARFVPHPGQYAVRGRGRDRACTDLARTITQQERRWLVLMDLRDAFGSATDLSPLPLPQNVLHLVSLLNYCDRDFELNADGLPQGAPASDIALASLVQPMLDMLPHEAVPFLYVDDFAGACGSADAAAATCEALMQALSTLPGGFSSKYLFVVDATDGFDFLGYHFRLDAQGELHIRVADHAFECLFGKCYFRAAEGKSVEEIERFLVAWRKAYALATLDDSELEEISNMASEAVLTVKQEMVTMWM